MDFACTYCRAVILGAKENCDKHEQTCDKNPHSLAATILAALATLRSTPQAGSSFDVLPAPGAGLGLLPQPGSLSTAASGLRPPPPMRPLPSIPESTGAFPNSIKTGLGHILKPPPGLPAPFPAPSSAGFPAPFPAPPAATPSTAQDEVDYEGLCSYPCKSGVPCMYWPRGCRTVYKEPPPAHGPPNHGPLLEHEKDCLFKERPPPGAKLTGKGLEGLACSNSASGCTYRQISWDVDKFLEHLQNCSFNPPNDTAKVLPAIKSAPTPVMAMVKDPSSEAQHVCPDCGERFWLNMPLEQHLREEKEECKKRGKGVDEKE